MTEQTPRETGQDPSQDLSHYWCGLYYNPSDPEVVVPKRYGVGLALNFARPMAYVLFLLPLLLSAVIMTAVLIFVP
jgi:uncharacterized membrane protein